MKLCLFLLFADYGGLGFKPVRLDSRCVFLRGGKCVSQDEMNEIAIISEMALSASAAWSRDVCGQVCFGILEEGQGGRSNATPPSRDGVTGKTSQVDQIEGITAEGICKRPLLQGSDGETATISSF